jgi:hypothetical protein
MAITQEQNRLARRMLIQNIFQRVNNTKVELVASDKEWEFYGALLDELYGPHWIPSITSLNGIGAEDERS